MAEEAERLDIVYFFKQKTAYEMRISDWSSDVCSSDLIEVAQARLALSSTAIWHGVVRIEPLQLRGVQVTMSPSSSAVASEPLAWPSYWPALPLPLTIELPKLALRDLRIQRDDAEPQTITAIDGGLQIASDQVRITALTIPHPPPHLPTP